MAKKTLADLEFGRAVTLGGGKVDRYGRLIAKIEYQGRDVNLALVSVGLAWWYRKYANEQSVEDRRIYEAAENTARERRLGLWADAEPVAPWDWRKR